jgi:indolepyruvate ferredoxin oxidoreductase
MRLEDWYSKTEGWLAMTGTQALVQLPIRHGRSDAASGLATGGCISGYRPNEGSRAA